VDLAGLTLQNQFFAAINDTNTSVEDTGSAGIFGLGFPVNSVIWTTIFIDERKTGTTKREIQDTHYNRPHFPDLSELYNVVASHLSRLTFPNIADLVGESKSKHGARQTTNSFSQAIAESYTRTGPLLGRLVATNALTLPQFTITLQRDTVDIGGSVGLLSIGELPKGIQNESLTWVPLRTYSVDQGGLPPPPDSPTEQYPITWEVFLDDVFLDGEKLPRSTLAPPNIALSALVDTGNSLLRGPADVVQQIRTKLGARFPCNEPHTLAFQIGGKLFPVDPRDFVNQEFVDSVSVCSANLVQTDPPAEGRYLYSWSLGDPFLKSVLASYYYGNLTHPSRDRPAMGFLSTVPPDADDKLKAAVSAAENNGGNFPALSEPAPNGVPTGAIQTDVNGVPSVKPTNVPKGNPASRAEATAWRGWAASILIVLAATAS
jgi:phytepsin